MTESIYWSDKIIFRFCCRIPHYETIKRVVIRIRKEYRFNICIIDTHVLHSVLFLIPPCKLMLLYNTVKIIINVSTYNQTVLGFAVHCLCIDVILLLVILHKPAFVLELLKILGCLGIHAWIILTCSRLEIYLRLYYVI